MPADPWADAVFKNKATIKDADRKISAPGTDQAETHTQVLNMR